MKAYDIIVIGGGASGLTAAISAKRFNCALHVAVLESGARVGKKLLTTGNGRCNVSNSSVTAERYRSHNLGAAMNIIDGFDVNKVRGFFRSLGVPICELENGKLYPYSLQAASVVDVLRFECEKLDISILTGVRALNVKSGTVVTAGDTYKARAIIVACGGKAAPSLGGCTDGYDLLCGLGHSCTKLYPAIVPVKTETEKIRSAKGIKADCQVTFSAPGEKRSETGEVLFTEYGISGPPVLQLSSFLSEHPNEDITAELDLLPSYNRNQLYAYIIDRAKNAYGDKAENLFLGLLNKRIGIAVIKYCGIGINDSCSSLKKSDIAALTDAVKSFRLKINGACGFDAAQVTFGGILLSEFDNELMSRKAKGVFACGEVLDVTGDCGGFNLQWAWSSGFTAGEAAARYAEENI